MPDRADRLSSRRKGRPHDDTPQSDEEDDTDNTVKTDNTDNTGKSDETSDAGNSSESARLSQTTKEQMMHLPESQHKRLHHLYTRMKADYEYEFDEDFELNRQYFPLVLQYGLDQFEQRDAEDVRQDLVEFGEDSQ